MVSDGDRFKVYFERVEHDTVIFAVKFRSNLLTDLDGLAMAVFNTQRVYAGSRTSGKVIKNW